MIPQPRSSSTMRNQREFLRAAGSASAYLTSCESIKWDGMRFERNYALKFPVRAPPAFAFPRSSRIENGAIFSGVAEYLVSLIIFLSDSFYAFWNDDACYHRLASHVSLPLAPAIPFR
jgi:hypothetical protein